MDGEQFNRVSPRRSRHAPHRGPAGVLFHKGLEAVDLSLREVEHGVEQAQDKGVRVVVESQSPGGVGAHFVKAEAPGDVGAPIRNDAAQHRLKILGNGGVLYAAARLAKQEPFLSAHLPHAGAAEAAQHVPFALGFARAQHPAKEGRHGLNRGRTGHCQQLRRQNRDSLGGEALGNHTALGAAAHDHGHVAPGPAGGTPAPHVGHQRVEHGWIKLGLVFGLDGAKLYVAAGGSARILRRISVRGAVVVLAELGGKTRVQTVVKRDDSVPAAPVVAHGHKARHAFEARKRVRRAVARFRSRYEVQKLLGV